MRHRLLAALLLVAVGRALSPDAVPVYDGIGAPDEPYRYVAAPTGSATTPKPSSARAVSPVARGISTYGLTVATAENGPQLSLFLPIGAVATGGKQLVVGVDPEAPIDQPVGARIDGNVYAVSLTGSGPVTLTPQAALASIYLRATTARQPAPVMQHRVSADQPWRALATKRGGQDIYVATFAGPGLYALAFKDVAPDDSSRTPYLLVVGLVVLLGAAVVVVRRQSSS